MSDDLRQLACLAQHKRHLVWRYGPQFSEYCQWCGIGWLPSVRGDNKILGELVRVYLDSKGQHTVCIQGDTGTLTQEPALALEAP